MNQLGLVHPALFEWLEPNFYPSLLTVQSPVESRSSTGAVITVWADMIGEIDLPCRIAPAGGAESRTTQQVTSENRQTCVVPIYLPGITTKDRAVVDGHVYDITAVDYDGQNLPGHIRRSTRLGLKVVK